MTETRTTTTDEEGEFSFDGVVLEHQYLVSARYKEVDYYYPVNFESGEMMAYVEVGVCDTTTSDESIRIGLAHAIISIEEECIRIIQVFWLVNDGDRTYVGIDGVLVFTLPEGAYSFEAPQEMMVDYQFLNDDKVTYLVPFPPGERQLAYSCCLAKPESNELALPLETDYPTDTLELMVQGEGIEVAASQLAPADPVVTDTGERFIHFRGMNISRGTVIDLYLSNLSQGSGLPPIVLWVIIAVVVVGIAVYLVKRRRNQNTDE
jgi:hypothetical protein